ncbi:uncharacterized protein BXZ73DRAFT_107642 [Epithele typhae]|uniref:uncharacterized protein n=1 Tax=Epithele typhae TaxID=378194 RepID=UPI002008C9E8|nr:uncharacterized protein BXZ73DRAFT_107642 [Epithele typhae]KAH9912096.1 hypothetical protein BXZ73DRAFT_107642 [Epithele typhae]
MAPEPISRATSTASTLSFASHAHSHPHSADYEDWENLKELFARAAERYDADDLPEAVALLRAVLRECHRFLIDHPDPSAVYTDPGCHLPSRSPETITPTEERFRRDWGAESDPFGTRSRRRSSTAPRPSELPTAFHAIFGIALFLMGSLVSQDSSIVLDGEPDSPSTYWLAALDVFETGENLPSRVGGSSFDTAEDWRMAIVWGRTLVSLADEKVTHNIKAAKATAASIAATGIPDYSAVPAIAGSPFSMSEPQWPPSSPFHAIAKFRPPVTRRMSLYSASAHDIMTLAMDQFSRGIFHMPHAHYSHAHNPSFIHTPFQPAALASASPSQSTGHFTSPASHAHSSPSPLMGSSTGSSGPADPLLSFSRPKELFTIASEVLGVAERLATPTERQYWAAWADSVFNQMKNEADMDAWRAPILSARGRCWLVMGSAPVEDMESALERGDARVLHSAEAEEAREGLAMAVSFFERARGSSLGLGRTGPGQAAAAGGEGEEDVGPLLAEALLVLANLTADENKREELYARAQTEAGIFDLGLHDGGLG